MTTARKIVVKVQLSLQPGLKTALVYNEDRTIFGQVQVSSDVAFAIGSDRAFFEATYGSDRMVTLDRRIPEQGW